MVKFIKLTSITISNDSPEVYFFNNDFVKNVSFNFNKEKLVGVTRSKVKIKIEFSKQQVYKGNPTFYINLEFDGYDNELFTNNSGYKFDIESNDDYLNKQFTILKRFFED